MATYYPNSTSQRDLMPAIYQRDLGHDPYTDSSLPSSNIVYLNYPSPGSYSDPMAEGSRAQHTLVELAIPTSMLSHEPSSHIGDNFFNAWGDGKCEMMHSVSGPASTMQLGDIVDGQRLSHPGSSLHGIGGQGLSLSLGRQYSTPSFQYNASNSDISFLGPHQSAARNSFHGRERSIYCEPPPPGLSDLPCPITNSKYLKAAQQLLEEVVNVQRALKQMTEKSLPSGASKENDASLRSDEMHQNTDDSAPNSVSEVSATDKQELHNKMTKLLNMLDEVDRRYKQYYHQMQAVVTSFDRIAGSGAAKPYTALALQTISRHFRSLRDAIDAQIRAAANAGLAELAPPSAGDRSGGIHRLRYVDQKLKQERAFQQHAWRPQRGLPETSVSILRAWLFEHFLHPYPKDSDKLVLARQTGLTRNQVSNWFINARVRLWKPMVEEMYKEEFGGPAAAAEGDSYSSGGGAAPPPPKDGVESLTPPPPPPQGGKYVSLTLGLHHCDGGGRGQGPAALRVNGMYDPPPATFGAEMGEYECLNLVERQQRLGGSSQLLHDFVV
ncbi:unnamed protein product [Spirodela intermedia]|uniref:Homeobox domain-containing protein n=1 Tax=Spirodela intermedia TaxID=51605 RepID=A0A7I8L1Z8_SPIIN|nr:unnamed protein product [Spirodela intermedia]